MSGIFDSIIPASISRVLSVELAQCYNLFVHHNESIDIDDELMDPPAFQIPPHMKWSDVHGLVVGEIGCRDDTQFMYLDDENDEIRIDSQEEYETALHICQKQRRDMHIYSVTSPRGCRRKKSKRKKLKETKKEPSPAQTHPVEDQSNEKPTLSTQTQQSPLEGAVEGDFIQMDEVTCSNRTEEMQETPPSNALVSLIRQEAGKIASQKLCKLEAVVGAMKRDIDSELDVIHDRIRVQKCLLDAVVRNEDNLRNSKLESSNISSVKSRYSEGEDAASLLCENLQEGCDVPCGQSFEKYWAFKNVGDVDWDEEVKLHRLDESCDPSAAVGLSCAVFQSVFVPPLKVGDSGVVCALLKAPAHPCSYQSSWRLSRNDIPFGPRACCYFNAIQQSDSTFDQGSRSLGSFVDVTTVTPGEDEKSVISTEQPHAIQPVEVQNDEAAYFGTSTEEVAHLNPVSSVRREETESPLPVTEDEASESPDSDANQSVSSASAVLVSPPSEAEERIAGEEVADDEEVKGDGDDEDVENFTSEESVEPRSFSSDDESDREEEENEDSAPETLPRSNSEDLQSVDFALEEEPASLTSYASGFVVIPLPDCFDVNKPLNGSQYLEKDDGTIDLEAKDEVPNSHCDEPDLSYSVDNSDSEPESQPASVTLAAGFRSEDSVAATFPEVPSFPQIPTPQIEDNAPPSGRVTPQPESLTDVIHKDFDKFLANAEHTVEVVDSPAPSKVPINQMSTTSTKSKLYTPAPQPVPESVTCIDTPYEIPNSQTTPSFPPFEQGWRRNPIAVPPSVLNDKPWPITSPLSAPPTQSPLKPLTQRSPSNFGASGFPPVPFAVASPSESVTDEGQRSSRPQRQLSPQIAITEDFFPVGTAIPGPNVDPAEEYDLFRTPPRSPTLPPMEREEIGHPLDSLNRIYEMGFHDIDLNRIIFESCERDLSRTVQALVLRAEADKRYNESA